MSAVHELAEIRDGLINIHIDKNGGRQDNELYCRNGSVLKGHALFKILWWIRISHPDFSTISGVIHRGHFLKAF